MNFTPKTPEEIAALGLLPAGIYPFTVTKGEDTVSKTSGNEMIKLQLRFYPPEGGETCVFDYLLESMPAKLIEFCQHTGLYDQYLEGHVAGEDCTGREGYAQLVIEKGTGKYPDKNTVKAYCAKPEGEATAAPPARSDAERGRNPGTGLPPDDGTEGDEIPF